MDDKHNAIACKSWPLLKRSPSLPAPPSSGIKEAVQGSDIRTLVMHTGRLEDLVQSQAALSVCSGHETGAGPIPK